MSIFAKHWLFAAVIVAEPICSHALTRHHDVHQNLFSSMSPSHWKRTCIEHTAASFDTLTTRSVALGPTSAGKHPFLPNLSAMNSTAWEQWVFDATADDGVGTIMVGLCRDPNYSFFGQGNLHVQFFAALGDSKPIQDLVFLDHSTIFDCGDYVAGHWASASKGYDFRFTVDQESNITALQVISPRFRGNLTFTASAQGHRPDGSSLAGSVQEDIGTGAVASSAAPGLHMYNAIPGAHVVGDIILDGSSVMPRFTSSGGAGVMRLWAAAYWFDIVAKFRFVRASAGPYSFFVWDSLSRWHSSGEEEATLESTHTWGAPYHGAEQLAAARHVPDAFTKSTSHGAATTLDHVRVSQAYGKLGAHGKVDGSRSTGHVVEFSSPATNRSWQFEVEHSRLQVSMPLGSGRGVDIFSNRVWGGEISNSPGSGDYVALHRGSGYSEDAMFPEELAPWRIWVVYGISMASQGWDAILRWVPSYGSQTVLPHDDL